MRIISILMKTYTVLYHIYSGKWLIDWCFSFQRNNVLYESFEYTTGVIRSRKSRDRSHNGEKGKEQTMTYKTLHRKLKIEIYTNPTKIRGDPGCSGKVSSSCSTCGTRRVTLVTDLWLVINEETTGYFFNLYFVFIFSI